MTSRYAFMTRGNLHTLHRHVKRVRSTDETFGLYFGVCERRLKKTSIVDVPKANLNLSDRVIDNRCSRT